jgi:hypothetical protein
MTSARRAFLFIFHGRNFPARVVLEDGNQLIWIHSLPPRLIAVSGMGFKGSVAREIFAFETPGF